MGQQLISPSEVVRYSPVDRNYPAATLCDLILQVEEAWFHDCLGDSMYEYLQSVLTEKPDGVKPWSSGKTYLENDVVLSNLCLFISTSDCNNTQPGEVGGFWEPLPKFTDDCANELWSKYVARILSFKVYSKSLIFTTYKSGSGGLTVNETNSSGVRAGNYKEVGMTQKELLEQIEETVQNMIRWLRKKVKDTSCSFPSDIPSLECETGCEKPNSSGRKFGLPNVRKTTVWGY